MLRIPDSLGRKAVTQIFDRISPVAWEKLFEREDENGIAKLRVQGDFQRRAYYSTAGLVDWLLRNAYYTPTEMRLALGEEIQVVKRAVTATRVHLLAG